MTCSLVRARRGRQI